MTGYFITFEGGEGAGKTSTLQAIAQRLREQNIDVVTTREPGGIVIAEEIRKVILNPTHTEMDGRTEALLYAAARRQHLIEKVVPALNAGKVVLCDRFIDSSLAYQGYARGLGIDEVYQINKFAIGSRMPDLTLFFDIEPEEGLRRINDNKEREQNRLDLETLEFHKLVYEGYQTVLKMFHERMQIIDANKSFKDVEEQVYKKISEYLHE